VKHRYRSAQVKAAVKVNGEKLLFNWQMGRDLVQKKAEERWGAGVVEQVSLDLKREFPNEDGFSTSNLWYMKKWYLFYTNHASSEKLQRLIGELQSSINQERLKLQRPVGELVKQPVSENLNDASNDFPTPFALVPWGQHIEIITRSESLEEALFYMQHVIDKGLSRTALVNCYKAHLFDHQGKIVNNFSTYLPEPQSHLVQEVLKENYDFGFATIDHELLICSDMDKTDVQWSFRGITTPMGVATYNNIRIKDVLPTQEQLKERMELLQKELRATKRLMKKATE